MDLKMKTLIVNRNTPDLAENQKRQIELMSKRILSLDNEIIIYNCEEEPFRGKCNGHYRALQEHQDKSCDYYWFNHPDLSFAIDMDCLLKLLAVMEKNPWIAVISPTEDTGSYIDMFKNGYRWHPVATCDYLSLLIRGSVIERIGFLNPAFEYSWGAIHEYSYKVYRNDWCIAYCDIAKMHHFGGTTYGRKDTTSREEYRKNARAFASKYFIEYYGENWDREFAKVIPAGITNIYSIHRAKWEDRHTLRRTLGKVFNHIIERYVSRSRIGGSKAMNQIKLQLGCGKRKKKKWVNIDIDDKVNPDILANVSNLNMFEDEAVAEIESCYPLESLAHPDTITALKEWHRVLRNGGRLFLELFNLGKDWTPEILGDELKELGFSEIKQQPATQTKEEATKYSSVIRLECIK